MKITGLVLLSFLLIAGCATTYPQQSYAGGNAQIDLLLSSRGALAHTDNRPHVEIVNGLDRAVTLDFEGPSHYEITVGDHRDAALDVEPGSYRVRASAPSVGSTQINGTVLQGTLYQLSVSPRRGEPR